MQIRRKNHTRSAASSSWQPVHTWYQQQVGLRGHYYHQHVVLPNSLRLLNLQPGDSVLDVGCGQGILARQLDPKITYVGVDAAPSLVQEAKRLSTNPKHTFFVQDATQPLSSIKEQFSHAVYLLSLQNMTEGGASIQHVTRNLQPKGKLLLVLNHPCFRIPRQSAWGIDEPKKLQYRRVDRYLQPLTIPIQAHPGQGQKSATTYSYHQPLSAYSQWLHAAGYHILALEEWTSNKRSVGKAAAMENRSREEFPLFLAILAEKA